MQSNNLRRPVKDSDSLIQIKQQSILYNGRQSTMVILHDYSALQRLSIERKNNVGMQRANSCISNEMGTPLKTIDLYTDILLRECSGQKKLCEFINAVKVGANMIRFSI